MDTFTAFLIIVTLFFLERLAMNSWLGAYFRFGIPIYHRTARRENLAGAGSTAANTAAADLSSRFLSSPLHPSVEFKDVRPNLVALREKFFENRAGARYLPVMHAALGWQDAPARVSLTGYLNWWVIAVVLYLFYQGTRELSFVPVAVLLGILFFLSYFLQADLFSKVFAAVTSQPETIREQEPS